MIRSGGGGYMGNEQAGRGDCSDGSNGGRRGRSRRRAGDKYLERARERSRRGEEERRERERDQERKRDFCQRLRSSAWRYHEPEDALTQHGGGRCYACYNVTALPLHVSLPYSVLAAALGLAASGVTATGKER